LSGKDEVELRVCNRGPDIPQEILATLFEPFRRVRVPHGSSKGLGLGLHIVSEIVRAHGGTLAAESQDGETRFVVCLPRGNHPEALEASAPA
jgi:sigma-B regulation protein RsbU (phosphoserine phosphatase)